MPKHLVSPLLCYYDFWLFLLRLPLSSSPCRGRSIPLLDLSSSKPRGPHAQAEDTTRGGLRSDRSTIPPRFRVEGVLSIDQGYCSLRRTSLRRTGRSPATEPRRIGTSKRPPPRHVG